jgi:AbrB family looped-hinge helix DNA binding protein
MTESIIHVNEQGRVVIPVHFRQQLGLMAGSKLVVRIEEDRLVLEKPEDVFKRLRATFNTPDSLVEELLSDRRTEAIHD